MSNTLLGFGLFALVAAIVGGGLKAFGFELGVLKSTRRQILLTLVGLMESDSTDSLPDSDCDGDEWTDDNRIWTGAQHLRVVESEWPR